MQSGITIKKELEQRAERLADRLQDEDAARSVYRQAGREALSQADSILQGLEYALEQPDGGSLSARNRPTPLPPIAIVRPDTAPNEQ